MTKTRSSQEKIVFGLALAKFLHSSTVTGICPHRPRCRWECTDLKLDVVMHISNTSAGEKGQKVHGICWLIVITESVNSKFREWPFLKNKVGSERGRCLTLISGLYMHTHMCTHAGTDLNKCHKYTNTIPFQMYRLIEMI